MSVIPKKMSVIPKLNHELLIKEAADFCSYMSEIRHESIIGVSDGKNVGTYVEHKFKDVLSSKYDVIIGNTASGIDLPSTEINTDIKVTSIAQPQSSCPFKSARQKIFGLGYNILLFVYEKNDSLQQNLKFLSCSFIHKNRTADFTTSKHIIEICNSGGNAEDIIGFLTDRNLPADEIELNSIAQLILNNPPNQGYLTISNALQWRLQYSRVITCAGQVEGVEKVYGKQPNITDF